MSERGPAPGRGAPVRRALAALASVGLVAACAGSRRPSNAAGRPRVQDGRAGSVSDMMVPDPDSGARRLPPNLELSAPSPDGPNDPPAYPAAPLAAQAPPASVGVRIVIGTRGHVVEVGESPVVRSTPGPFAADFRAAAEAAVRAWRFRPARLRRLEPGDDYDGDGKPDFTRVVGSEAVPSYVDVRFDFEIVAGKGVVRRADPAPAS